MYDNVEPILGFVDKLICSRNCREIVHNGKNKITASSATESNKAFPNSRYVSCHMTMMLLLLKTDRFKKNRR